MSQWQNRSPRVVNDSVVAKTAASGNGRGNCLPPSCQAQDEFLDAQKRLQNIKCQRSSNPETKRDIIKSLRGITAFTATCALTSHQQDWVENRRNATQRVDNCIRGCFGGNDEAFYCEVASLPLSPSSLYKCHHFTSTQETKKDCMDDQKEEFQALKNKIQVMESAQSKQSEQKKALFNAWKDAQRFSGKMGKRENEWLERRQAAIGAIQDCATECWDGDADTLFGLLTGWPHNLLNKLHEFVCEQFHRKPAAVPIRAGPRVPNALVKKEATETLCITRECWTKKPLPNKGPRRKLNFRLWKIIEGLFDNWSKERRICLS